MSHHPNTWMEGNRTTSHSNHQDHDVSHILAQWRKERQQGNEKGLIQLTQPPTPNWERQPPPLSQKSQNSKQTFDPTTILSSPTPSHYTDSTMTVQSEQTLLNDVGRQRFHQKQKTRNDTMLSPSGIRPYRSTVPLSRQHSHHHHLPQQQQQQQLQQQQQQQQPEDFDISFMTQDTEDLRTMILIQPNHNHSGDDRVPSEHCDFQDTTSTTLEQDLTYHMNTQLQLPKQQQQEPQKHQPSIPPNNLRESTPYPHRTSLHPLVEQSPSLFHPPPPPPATISSSSTSSSPIPMILTHSKNTDRVSNRPSHSSILISATSSSSPSSSSSSPSSSSASYYVANGTRTTLPPKISLHQKSIPIHNENSKDEKLESVPSQSTVSHLNHSTTTTTTTTRATATRSTTENRNTLSSRRMTTPMSTSKTSTMHTGETKHPIRDNPSNIQKYDSHVSDPLFQEKLKHVQQEKENYKSIMKQTLTDLCIHLNQLSLLCTHIVSIPSKEEPSNLPPQNENTTISHVTNPLLSCKQNIQNMESLLKTRILSFQQQQEEEEEDTTFQQQLLKEEDTVLYQRVYNWLQKDIPQYFTNIQQTLLQQIQSTKEYIQSSYQEMELKIQQQSLEWEKQSTQSRQQWEEEMNGKKLQLEASQKEFALVQSQYEEKQRSLQQILQRMEDLQNKLVEKQKEFQDIQTLCDTRVREAHTMETKARIAFHESQEKVIQLSKFETSLLKLQEKLNEERLHLRQERVQFKQEQNELQTQQSELHRKQDEMILVQGELLELEVVQQQREEELKVFESNVTRQKEELQEKEKQNLREKNDLEQLRLEVHAKYEELESAEKEYNLKLNNFFHEQEEFNSERENFAEKLNALERREIELTCTHDQLNENKVKFTKAVSMAKLDLEKQRLQLDVMRNELNVEKTNIEQEKKTHENLLKDMRENRSKEEEYLASSMAKKNMIDDEAEKTQKKLEDLQIQVNENQTLLAQQLEKIACIENKFLDTQREFTELHIKKNLLLQELCEKESLLKDVLLQIGRAESDFRRIRDSSDNEIKLLQTERENLKVERESFQIRLSDAAIEAAKLKARHEDLIRAEAELQQKSASVISIEEKSKKELNNHQERLKCQEGLLREGEERLRSSLEQLSAQSEELEKRQLYLNETEIKLNKFAHLLKKREREQREREKSEKISRESEFNSILSNLKEMLEIEKHRYNELMQEKIKLEEESLAKDTILQRLQSICTTEESLLLESNASLFTRNTVATSESLSRLRDFALELKQKEEAVNNDRLLLERKLSQCNECESRLTEWQKELQTLAESLLTTGEDSFTSTTC